MSSLASSSRSQRSHLSPQHISTARCPRHPDCPPVTSQTPQCGAAAGSDAERLSRWTPALRVVGSGRPTRVERTDASLGRRAPVGADWSPSTDTGGGAARPSCAAFDRPMGAGPRHHVTAPAAFLSPALIKTNGRRPGDLTAPFLLVGATEHSGKLDGRWWRRRRLRRPVGTKEAR